MFLSHNFPFGTSSVKATNPLMNIHTIVWGPAPIMSNSGYKWYVSFVDEFTIHIWIYFLKNKDVVPNAFLFFKSYKKIKRLKLYNVMKEVSMKHSFLY